MRSFWLAFLLAAQAGAETTKQKVAMLEPRAEPGVAQGTANLLGEVIASDIARSDKYELITASDINTLLSAERQKQLLGCSEDESCMAEIGSALGVDLMLDVSVGAVGNLRVLAMRLISTRQAAALRRESETVPGDAELVGAGHRLTAKLFDLPPPPTRRERMLPGFLVLGGAGALTLGGVAMGISASGDYQSFRSDPFNDPLGDRAKAKAFIADGLYLGALVTAGVATYLLVTGSSAAEGY